MSNLLNALLVAGQGVRRAPIRSILTALALAMAVVGLITVTAASTSVRQTLTQRAVLQGGELGTFKAGPFEGALAVRDARRVSTAVNPLSNSGAVSLLGHLDGSRIDLPAQSVDAEIVFTDARLQSVFPYIQRSGRWLPADSARSVARVVLNEAFTQQSGSRVGDTLSVVDAADQSPLPGVVRGIVYDGSDAPKAYVSLSDASAFLARNVNDLSMDTVYTSTGTTSDFWSSRISEYASFGSISGVPDVRRLDTLSSLSSGLSAVTGALFTIGAIGLICGFLAIANVGLSASRERSSELVLRRSLGASRRFISGVMILEAILVAIPASGLAVLVSMLVYPLVVSPFASPYGLAAPAFPATSALLGVVLGLACGVATSLFAVLGAFRIAAVDVLRA